MWPEDGVIHDERFCHNMIHVKSYVDGILFNLK
jgi:hypothetical protein